MTIPRVFHRIWLGSRPMPDEYVKFGQTWTHLNPDWEMQLWTDDNLPNIVNRRDFDAFQAFAGKADILRYELLWRFGGIYLDTDFEAFKPLDLLDGVNSFFADQWAESPAVGILGTFPRNPFYRHLIDRLPESIRTHSDHVEKAGPPFFARELDAFFGRNWRRRRMPGTRWGYVSATGAHTIHALEAQHFYPYPYWEPHRRHEVFPDAYAAHHWAHSWW